MKETLFDYPRLKDFPPEMALDRLYAAFEGMQLDVMKKTLLIWRDIALIADSKAYHTEDELDTITKFTHDFTGLIGAMYCIYAGAQVEDDNEKLGAVVAQYHENYFKPGSKIIHPFNFPDHFLSLLDLPLAHHILWVIFEAVIIYDGELKMLLDRQELVRTYERWFVLLESAAAFRKKFDKVRKKSKGSFKLFD